MSGLFSNPANWGITDYLQGQPGGDPTPGFNAPSAAPLYRALVGTSAPPSYTVPAGTGTDTRAVLGATSTAQQIPSTEGNPTASGAGGQTIDPQTLAQYDQAIGNLNAGIGRLGDQYNSGNSAIGASYNNALNQLLLGRNRGQQSYDTNKQQTGQDFIQGKNTIGANAGSTLSGLFRLLGARGAGGGSAYNLVAPQAVARGATIQRADATNTYGQNNQALDTNWNNFLTDYNNQVSGAGNQRDQAKQTLQQQIDSSRANLLQSLAQLTGQRTAYAGGDATAASQPYLDQANALLDKASNYSTPEINYQTNAYQAPSLASYTSSPVTPTYQGQAPQNDYFSPYLSALLGKKQLATG